jgi:hypothetical protein
VSNCDFVAGGSLIDLAASRLALRAPALRAATALTRPNQSAQRLPSGRHAVPTAATLGPMQVVAERSVENGEHLTHHRHDHDLRLLSGRPKTVVECLEHRVPIARAHRCHVEHAANGCTAAPDTPCSFELATIEGIGRDSDQGCDLPSTELAELGQECDQLSRGCAAGVTPVAFSGTLTIGPEFTHAARHERHHSASRARIMAGLCGC